MLVTKEAPDFTAEAFTTASHQINLSDYRGKWVVVCFIPRFHVCMTH